MKKQSKDKTEIIFCKHSAQKSQVLHIKRRICPYDVGIKIKVINKKTTSANYSLINDTLIFNNAVEYIVYGNQ